MTMRNGDRVSTLVHFVQIDIFSVWFAQSSSILCTYTLVQPVLTKPSIGWIGIRNRLPKVN